MLFDKKLKPGDYEVLREGEDIIIRVNYEGSLQVPSIEDNPIVMARTVEKLVENKDATKVVFYQKRDYEYEFNQIVLLKEIGLLYNEFIKQKAMFSYEGINFGGKCKKCLGRRFADIQYIIFHLLKSDPVGAFVKLKRMLREEKVILLKLIEEQCIPCQEKYIALLNYIIQKLEKTKLIRLAKPHIEGMHIGEREVYRTIFKPIIKPDFMYTKLMSSYPEDGEEIENYTVGENTEITVFQVPGDVRTLYHIMPPEFKLSEGKYELLDLARRIMAEHKPTREEFVNPERMRQIFFNVGRDLIEELANYRNVKMKDSEMDELTKVLVRYTVGFGLIEVLLADEEIQDISVNSPLGNIPIFIVHGKFGDCITNIIPTRTEAESWASKLRMISGRPLDEANPILDTELNIPGASIRISTITEPLDPTGIAFSFRRHRDKPWTLPLFMKFKMINDMAAGLLSFCVDGTRSMLVVGTRSSGKTSFLSSLLVEIMRRYRIITIEDTLELPTDSMRRLGFNIQPMKVASALAKGSSEMNASDGIRSTLRLGDSALIVGEVRSEEAKALYEAMRVGAAANVVAGTIHGDSPYGIFDRVVNDIGVPKTSFKATDLCIIANPIKSADGLHKFRRVVQITEVRKFWEEDPLTEGGFVDLMKYDAKSDQLQPSSELMDGDSEILKAIAANIPDFAGNWDALWENIELRAKTKKTLTDYSMKLKDDDMLEAPFVIRCNDQMHLISEKVKEETGSLDAKRIYEDWETWFKRELKRRSLRKKEEQNA